MIRRQENGEINCDDLEAMIRVNRDVPAVIMANVGTTMRGAIILTADNYDRALYVLNQAGFKAVGDDPLVVRLPDEPGALANVAGSLKDAGVNIESMHILSRQAGYAMIALKTDDRPRAIEAIGIDVVV